jgi:hypothetical protein
MMALAPNSAKPWREPAYKFWLPVVSSYKTYYDILHPERNDEG